MGRFWEQFKHAFALDPDPEGDGKFPEILERFASKVVEKNMETPVIIALESMGPVSFLAGQAMHATWPLVNTFTDFKEFKEIAHCLEDRQTVSKLANRIEQLAHKKDGRL